jgi:ABC-type branched-subunit amino acid transport system substrate-binding protein
MDIYCTRPHCEQPLNSFSDLDDSKFFKTEQQHHCAHCEMPLVLDGRYVPLKLLKQDEYGSRFLGGDLHTPELKRCIIDRLSIDPSFDSNQLEIATKLFHREAEVLDKLGAHPKIPRLLASLEILAPVDLHYKQQQLFYLVREYIEGQNLESELLAKGKFTESEVIIVLREVASILEFIHFKDVIHRNIKPSNIIRDAQGKIYLVNFGAIDRIVAETISTTPKILESNLASVFTLEYTLDRQPQLQTIYPSSDLYSLAVTCLNLLTGKQPQELLDPETNHWQWRTPDLQISDTLTEILNKMVEYLPTDRFQSARDILDLLETISGPPVLSIPTASISDSNNLLSATIYNDLIQLDEDLFDIDDDSLPLDDDFLPIDYDLPFDYTPLPLEDAPLQVITKVKPQRKQNWVVVGFLATGIIGLIATIVPRTSVSNYDDSYRFSSRGEKILLSFEGNRDTEKFKELKRDGVLAIASKNYPEAVSKLQAALVENPNSPETRIYLNNASIGDKKSYTIAVAAPIARSLDRASEMLRGFAQAQFEMNQAGGVNEPKIKLIIVDDSDDPKTIEKIATNIVDRSEVLGIVGHNRNDVTMKAANIYDKNKLAFIAPISTASKLTSTDKPYIFRTNIKGDSIAQKLVDRLIDKDRKRKVAIFYVPRISYNDEFKTQFVNKLTAKGGKVVGIFPFSSSSSNTTAEPRTFDAEAHIKKAKQMGAEAILLLPVGRSQREAIQILKLRASKYPELTVLADTALYSLKTLTAGKETEGLIIGVPWQESESTPQFSTGARQLWNNKVNWATATSYNAVKALGTAIKAQESPSRSNVIEILSKNEFMGASGRFQFTKGEPTERYILVQVARTPSNYKYSSGTGYDFVPIEWLF